jgi:hypothetical protein
MRVASVVVGPCPSYLPTNPLLRLPEPIQARAGPRLTTPIPVKQRRLGLRGSIKTASWLSIIRSPVHRKIERLRAPPRVTSQVRHDGAQPPPESPGINLVQL